MDWSRLVGWKDPWSPGELSLAAAWEQCPDGRWMYASATYAGVEPRALTGALCACVRDLDVSAEEEWDVLLVAAGRYADGTDSLDQLTAALPPLSELSTWRPSAEKLRRIATGMHRSEAAGAMASDLAGLNLVRALHPGSSDAERAEGGANALGFLAALYALDARRSSREVAKDMLDEVAQAAEGASLGALAGRAAIERESSPSWDESAARAFGHALSRCADRVRESISSPFAG